ncbi:predicted protein [Histoplasma capsulatum var. duboisii H88]|uniref:Predicted protein n=2 Tax=Ajellomyces capsulatus TaxID=5037 RepID=F0UCJ1_AJEC8|nr:predicted protein [Histoplasma capsulatum H143]EGC43267.1 predicted protein [Histoplasma capsulatum var. duboisii H88]
MNTEITTNRQIRKNWKRSNTPIIAWALGKILRQRDLGSFNKTGTWPQIIYGDHKRSPNGTLFLRGSLSDLCHIHSPDMIAFSGQPTHRQATAQREAPVPDSFLNIAMWRRRARPSHMSHYWAQDAQLRRVGFCTRFTICARDPTIASAQPKLNQHLI